MALASKSELDRETDDEAGSRRKMRRRDMGLHMSGAEWAAWLAVVVAVVAIGVGVAIARWQRPRRQLSFEAYTEFPLLARGPLAQQIEVSAAGQKLKLPHILLVTITNSGNAALRPEAFYEGIHVEFNDAHLFALHVAAAPDITVSATMPSQQSIVIDPLLLNPGEGMVCYALVDGCPHGVKVRARIADAQVRDISRSSVSESLLGTARFTFRFLGVTIRVNPRGHLLRASHTDAPPGER